MSDHQRSGTGSSTPPGVYSNQTSTHSSSRPSSPAALLNPKRNQRQELQFMRQDSVPGYSPEPWSQNIRFDYTQSTSTHQDITDMTDITTQTSTALPTLPEGDAWNMMGQQYASNTNLSTSTGEPMSGTTSMNDMDASFLDVMQPSLAQKPAVSSHGLDSMLTSSSSSTANTETTLFTNTSSAPHLALQTNVPHPHPTQQNQQLAKNHVLTNFMVQGDHSEEDKKRENSNRMQLPYGLPTSTKGGGLYHQNQPSSYTDRVQQDLRLTDLSSIHQRHQQQLLQSWSAEGAGSTTTGSPNPALSPASSAFFTPSFLDSLQQDERDEDGLFTPSAQDNSGYSVPTWQHDQLGYEEFQSTQTSFSSLDAMMSPTDRPNLFIGSPPQSPHTSPPITPVYGRLSNLSLRQSAIHEAEEDYSRSMGTIDRRQIKMARMMQNATHVAKIRNMIQSYLNAPDPSATGEKTVILLTSKVAQKSYGTEKRFLCPPPIAILIGTTWWVPKDKGGELGPPRLTVYISGETATQTGQLEWYTLSGATVGQTGHPKASPSKNDTQANATGTSSSLFHTSDARLSGSAGVDWYHNHQQEPLGGGKCVAKQLYINDADEKRKRVECLIRIQLANGIPLGTLASKGIKVISKPSKKRQSIKNMELCIHHGTTVSLFNRIRSQTVSTKYLGVSSGSPFSVPGYRNNRQGTQNENTCFVARTTSWDPFVIWLVDTTRSPTNVNETDNPKDYIGHPSLMNENITYPPPPAIALKNTLNQPMPIHYNQHIVLQCLTTGLVSPVMIIRKIDKASTAVGGAQATMEELGGGGEFGDEVLGDPVSQLHKIALQIVQDPSQAVTHHQAMSNAMQRPGFTPSSQPVSMPRSARPITYLACLNDMVGMHKTTDARHPIAPSPVLSYYGTSWDDEESKGQRKRRPPPLDAFNQGNRLAFPTSTTDPAHRRVSSHNEPEGRRGSHPYHEPFQALLRTRAHSVAGLVDTPTSPQQQRQRRMSLGTNSSTNSNNMLGAYWSENVSDAAVWTIVGTDCATYTFLASDNEDTQPLATPYPSITTYVTSKHTTEDSQVLLTLHGENFCRDMQVWFGDVKSPHTEYRGRELFICRVPPRNELLQSVQAEARFDASHTVPILLVRGDGIIFKTRHVYRF